MHLKKARIQPVEDHEFDDEHRRVLKDLAERNALYQVIRTLARNPKAFEKFGAWGGYILNDVSITPREREILILRTGYNWKQAYEWAQHVIIGKRAGLSDGEIEAIKVGSTDAGWSDNERALLQAADDLKADAFISDDTWAALTDYDEIQKMDIVFTVSHYTQVCMALHSFGVQLDHGLTADPDLMP